MSTKKIPPKQPFSTPENHYFEKLPERTLARIKAQKKVVAMPSMYAQKRVWLSLAAAVVLLLFVVRVGLFSPNATQKGLSENALASFTDTELQSYLLYSDVENSDLAALLPEEEAILAEFSEELDELESLEDLPVEISVYDMY